MYPRLRTRKRFLSRAIAAALTLLVCGGAVDWGHLGGDDADCNIVVVPHDHAAHRFAANPSGAAPAADHCYICHSLRLLHVALAARQERAAIDLQRTQLGDAFDAVAGQRVGVALSSRAPPLTLL
jgi:hypothetical protein